MKKVNTVTTTTYETDIPGFLVDITTEKIAAGTMCFAWIYHTDYGVKSLMFGGCKNRKTFMELVEPNIEHYAETYKKKYMDED